MAGVQFYCHSGRACPVTEPKRGVRGAGISRLRGFEIPAFAGLTLWLVFIFRLLPAWCGDNLRSFHVASTLARLRPGFGGRRVQLFNKPH